MRNTRTKKPAHGLQTLAGWNGVVSLEGWDNLLRPDIHAGSYVMYGVLPAKQKPDWEFILVSARDEEEDPVEDTYVVRGLEWQQIVNAYENSQKDRDRLGGSGSPSSGPRLTMRFISRTLAQTSGRYRKPGTLGVLDQTDGISAFHHSSSGGQVWCLPRLKSMPPLWC